MNPEPGLFRYARRVQFAETDLAGIVHFSWYFRYMEEAEHALWRTSGLTIERAGAQTGWPRVAASFEYKHPLLFEDQFEDVLRITALGRRSITYAHTFQRGDTIVGTGTITTVHVSKDPDGSMKSVDIPGEFLARLRATLADGEGEGARGR
ncbi:MAG TPA: thioesterase family protein [Vicinamibacterales bacterium]|nr:thioesterase family protein [Vicinamibacterales bacterium]